MYIYIYIYVHTFIYCRNTCNYICMYFQDLMMRYVIFVPGCFADVHVVYPCLYHVHVFFRGDAVYETLNAIFGELIERFKRFGNEECNCDPAVLDFC